MICQRIFVVYKRIKMRIVIQLIENYLRQEIPTVSITTDNNRYIFNVPSSYQRFTRQHKNSFPFGAKFFFTKTSTASITGLTGLILSLFHMKGCQKVKLYTDQKMFRYMQELRYKMGYKGGIISYCSWQGKLRRGILHQHKIENLSLSKDFASTFQHFEEFIQKNLPKEDQNNAMNHYDTKNIVFKDQELEIKPFFIQQNGEMITNYIIMPGQLPGKILSDKLKELGIKGKMIGQLTKDGQITVQGKIVYLSDVREEATPSPNVILLHYKERQTIGAILNNQRLAEFLQDKRNMVYSVIHIVQSSQTVLSPEFKGLLAAFPPQTQHLVYNNRFRNSDDSLQELVRINSQIRMVSELSKHFPLCMPDLISKNKEFVQKFVSKTEAIDLMFPGHKVKAYKRRYELIVAPKKSWGYTAMPGGDRKQSELNFDFEMPKIDLQLEEKDRAKFQEIDPKIVFLGTGSMKPSKYRNVSSILVEWIKGHYIMMDCGQGSHIQLTDHYGHQRYEEVLLGLRTIFITHIHSDHNLGLLDVISERNRLLRRNKIDLAQNKLFLVLPANVVPWYNSFCKNVEDLNEGCEVIFIQALRNQDYSFEGTMSKEPALNQKCSVKSQMVEEAEEDEESEDQLTIIKPEWDNILKEYYDKQKCSLQLFQQYLQTIGIDQFYPCPVIHCPQSHGICIRHRSGVKVSYSGDTRPCPEFAQAAKNSTIMIHEATFGDDLQHNAFCHFHSTVGEAIDIAMQSESWKLALTHFSQRYKSASEILDPRNYFLNKNKRQYADQHTIICFDHFEIPMSKAHVLPKVSQAVASALPKDSNQ